MTSVGTAFFLSVSLVHSVRTLFQGDSGHPLSYWPLQCGYGIHLLYSYTLLSQFTCLLGSPHLLGDGYHLTCSQVGSVVYSSRVCVCVHVCVHVHSLVSDSLQTQWIVAHQAPLSMEFSRQEYWSG